ncbi:MAG: LamG-like jellyroll fold domain-containing protein [Acidimicrobiales bacterium]
MFTAKRRRVVGALLLSIGLVGSVTPAVPAVSAQAVPDRGQGVEGAVGDRVDGVDPRLPRPVADTDAGAPGGVESTGVAGYSVDPETGRTVWDVPETPEGLEFPGVEIREGKSPVAPAGPVETGFVPGESRYLPDMSDPTRHVFLNPDNTITAVYTDAPTEIDVETGVPFTPPMVVSRDGSALAFDGSQSTTRVPAGRLDAAGGSLFETMTDDGERFAFDVVGQRRDVVGRPERVEEILDGVGARVPIVPGRPDVLPVPAAEAGRVVFDGLLDGVDTVVTPTPEGAKIDYVADTADAAAGIVEQLTVPEGWSFSADLGVIVLLDPDGVPGGVWSGGPAFDANGENETQVWLELEQVDGSTATARVMVDPEWLADPKVAFPVTLDPIVTIGALNDTWVQQNEPNNRVGSDNLRAGPFTGGLWSRSYTIFDDDLFTFGPSKGWRVDSASLNLLNFYSNTCSSHATYVRRVTTPWSPSGIVWTNKPESTSVGEAFNLSTYGGSGCADNWLGFDVTAIAQYWSEFPGSNYGFEIRSTETGSAAFKQFYSNDWDTEWARPYLTINYETHGAYYTPTTMIGDPTNDFEDVLLPVPGTTTTASDGRFPMLIANRGVLNWPSGTPVETDPAKNVCATYHINQANVAAPAATWGGLSGWHVLDGARTCPSADASNMADLYNSGTPTVTDLGMLLAIRGSHFTAPGLYDVYFGMVHDGVTWFEIEGSPLAAKQPIRWTAPPRVTNLDDGTAIAIDEPIVVNVDKPYDTGAPGAWTPTNYRVKWAEPGNPFIDADAITTTGTTLTIPVEDLPTSPGPVVLCVQARDGVSDPNGGPEYWTQCEYVTVMRGMSGLGANPLGDHAGGFANSESGVDAGTGNFFFPSVDFASTGVTDGFGLTRNFNSASDQAGIFGPGFRTSFEASVELYPPTTECTNGTPGPDCVIIVHHGDASTTVFTQDGSPTLWKAANGTNTTAEITTGYEFVITYKDGSTEQFTSPGFGDIESMTSPEGHELSIQIVHGQHPGVITDVVSGRTITLNYLNVGTTASPVWQVDRARMVVDGVNLDWTYQYTNGFLTKACDPRGNCTSYSWFDHDNEATGLSPDKLRTITTPENHNSSGVPQHPLTLNYNTDGLVTSTVDPAGDTTSFDYVDDDTTIITDARQNDWTLTFDAQNRTKTMVAPAVAPDGPSTTTYEYDGPYRTGIIDGSGRSVVFDYDDDGNLLSETKTDGTASETTYYAYTPSAYANPDVITGPSRVCDARSASSTDTTFCTTFTYDAFGNKTSEQAADETTTTRQRWVYTDGSTSITGDAGVGVPPAGLLRYHYDGNTSAQGGEGKTTYFYNSKGDLVGMEDPAGLVTVYTHDSLGRVLTETITYTDDGNTMTAATSFTYDNNSNLKTVTGPPVTNPVTNTAHRLRTTYTYDANNNQTGQLDEDIVGTDPDREWTRVFDVVDREYQTFDPEGEVTSREFDANGNVDAVIDPAGNRVETLYDARNQADIVTAKAFDDGHGGTPTDRVLTDYSYDQAGRVETENAYTSASAFIETSYGYDHAGRRTTTKVKVNGTQVTVASDTYTGGYLTQSIAGNASATAAQDKAVTTNGYYPNGRLHTSETGGRTTTYVYDPAGNPTTVTVTGTDAYDASLTTLTTTTLYDSAGRPVDVTVTNDDGDDARTTTSYDERGHAVSVIGPLGYASGANPQDHRTDVRYDPVGRRFETTQPAVAYQHATTSTGIEAGWTSGTAMPITLVGYNTFGDPTHTTDPNGNTTITAYDDNGRRTGITHPTYTPPTGATVTPTETWTYDNNGNVATYTSRNSHITSYDYDGANRVTLVTDPQIPNAADTGLQTAGVTQTFYDRTGRVITTIAPEGATTTNIWDELGRLETTSMAVRAVATQPALTATTSMTYSWLGYLTTSTDGEGVTTTVTYDTFGNPLTTKTQDLTATTTLYDGLGRPRSVNDPANGITITDYDTLGRALTITRKDTSGTIYQTATNTWDTAGNLQTVTDARGGQTVYGYDALSRLTDVTQTVSLSASITTNYGYDRAGNHTRLVDGEGHSTRYVYNVWNLPEITLEPSATTSPVEPEANRRWTMSYDKAGQSVHEAHPGGRVVTRTFNALGLPEVETSTEPGAATVAKTWGYDRDQRPVRLSHPTAPIVLTYDDRGLLVGQTGGAGDASFTYDQAGRPVTRTDEAGTRGFTYTTNGQTDTVYDGTPPAGPTRVTGSIAEYLFAGGTGTTVADVSGVTPAINLTIANPANTTWSSTGLSINTATKLETSGAATRINNAITATGELTLEAWIDPANLTQNGPARIMTLSSGAYLRNTTLGQQYGEINMRTRASNTTNNGIPMFQTSNTPLSTDLIHVVATHDASGNEVIYADGQVQATTSGVGTITNWDSNYKLLIANETSNDRAWLGEICLAAIYDEALSAAEVAQNYSAGCPTTTGGGGGGGSGAWSIDYTYDTAGRLIDTIYAGDGHTAGTYDNVGRVSTETIKDDNGTTTASTAYHYDCVGQLIAKDTDLDGNAGEGLNAYTYDLAGRLTSWNDAATAVPPTCPGNGSSGPSRVAGTVVEYVFAGQSGTTVADTSGNGTALNLTIANPANTTWSADGLAINSATVLSTAGPATKVANAINASDALTLEAWVAPANTTQAGPARIITNSSGAYLRNTTLGQEGDEIDFRVRAANTSNNGYPTLRTTNSPLDTDLIHLVATHDAAGNQVIYADGAVQTTWNAGVINTFDTSYKLYIGNESSNDRAWLGEICLAAIYDEALTATEVAQNYAAGCPTTTGGGGGESPPTGVIYTYDNNGNRLTAGTESFEYDDRNRLTSDPDGTYSWDPAGTLATYTPTSGPAETYTFDAAARLTGITDGTTTTSYGYDNLDRIATRGTADVTYTGGELDPTSDGTNAFHRDPAGRLLAYDTGTTVTHAATDGHNDLYGLINPDGTLSDTATFDPYGDPIATTGTTNPVLGYQTDYTDPTTGHVWMGARWYQPSSATFLSRDTYSGELVTPFTLNRYTYALNNPNKYWDPDGRCANQVFDYCLDQINVGGKPVYLGTTSLDPATRNYEGTTPTITTADWDATVAQTINATVAVGNTPTVTPAAATIILQPGGGGCISSFNYSADGRITSFNQGRGPECWKGDQVHTGGVHGVGTYPYAEEADVRTQQSQIYSVPDYANGATAWAALVGATRFLVFDERSCRSNDGTGGLSIDAGCAAEIAVALPWTKLFKGAKALRYADEAADAAAVAPRNALPPLRQAYVDDVASLADEVAAWRKAGADPEVIAREAWANRRAIGIQYKDLTPPDMLTQIHARNLQKYGDRLGPTIDWLRAQGKTWDQIIESATRTGGKDLGF